MRITILCGGASSEREVSLMTSAEIGKALDPAKYEVTVIELPASGGAGWVTKLIASAPHLVVSALHGGLGENGAVQGLLECLGIPYLGSKILGSALCMDKAMSKSVMRANNIPVPDDIIIRQGETLAQYRNAVARMGFPSGGKVVVKPNQGGSSVGVSIVESWVELESAFLEAAHSGGSVLIEQFIPGREITCGIIEAKDGLKTLPLLDISAGEGASFYDYNAKYFSSETDIRASELPPFVRGLAERLAEQAFIKLHCAGYARVDMIARGEQVYVLEVNTLPGLTSHSLLPNAAGLMGWSFERLMDALIDHTLRQRAQ